MEVIEWFLWPLILAYQMVLLWTFKVGLVAKMWILEEERRHDNMWFKAKTLTDNFKFWNLLTHIIPPHPGEKEMDTGKLSFWEGTTDSFVGESRVPPPQN